MTNNIFSYDLPIGEIKTNLPLNWMREDDVKINHITDVKEFKKDNFNFISLNFQRLENLPEDQLISLLNKDYVNLINTDIAKLIIDFSNEGVILDYYFLAIHRMISKWKIKSSNIYFISCDTKLGENYETWAIKHGVSKINIISLNKHLTISKGWIREIEKFNIDDFKVDRIREKKFTCLNGDFKSWRLLLVTELFKRGLDKDGYISLIGNYGEDPLIEWEIDNVDKNLIKYYKDIIYPKLPIVTEIEKNLTLGKSIVDFYKNKEVDIDNWNEKVSKYPLDYVHEMYTNTYFNVVTETAYNWDSSSILGNSVYLSEKTLKPIFGMQPFIVVTNPGFLKFLKSMGFETFPEFFDESYDEIEHPLERMSAIVKEIKKICSLSYEEIHDKYYSIFDKLEHNRNRLLEISDDKKIVHGNYSAVFKTEKKEC